MEGLLHENSIEVKQITPSDWTIEYHQPVCYLATKDSWVERDYKLI